MFFGQQQELNLQKNWAKGVDHAHLYFSKEDVYRDANLMHSYLLKIFFSQVNASLAVLLVFGDVLNNNNKK